MVLIDIHSQCKNVLKSFTRELMDGRGQIGMRCSNVWY